jgi:hypothetical protein
MLRHTQSSVANNQRLKILIDIDIELIFDAHRSHPQIDFGRTPN